MPKRVAITIAGAVSLGSYEGGVVYELLEAFRTWNEAADTAGTPDKKIYIDVITGASAGGMTAAMLAQRLMFDGASMFTNKPVRGTPKKIEKNGEFSNPLYYAWVERISLAGLVDLGKTEGRWNSLFSSNLICTIGTEMLVEAMAKPTLPKVPHATIEEIPGVIPSLRVGLALTNLSGVNYMIPIQGSVEGGFNYTNSADQKHFIVQKGDEGNVEQWEAMRNAAVGSGAFPVAFRPKGIERDSSEYVTEDTPLWPGKDDQKYDGTTYLQWGNNNPAPFAYADGGVLQNQPLGIAKNLVDVVVQERVEAARGSGDAAALTKAQAEAYHDARDRLYVFISPNAVKSTAEDLEANRIKIWQMLKQLFNTYTRQATFHDWIMAEQMNQKVRLLDERANELCAAILAGVLDIGTLQAASTELNDLLLRGEGDAPIERLKEQYQHEFERLEQGVSNEAATAFLSALATLEAAARLENNDKMKIVAVIANGREELAGSGLAAFVGFFNESFRQYDYWMGRIKTRAYLQRKDVKGILGVDHWPEEGLWGTVDASMDAEEQRDVLMAKLPHPEGLAPDQVPLAPSKVLKACWKQLCWFLLLRPALWVIPVCLVAALLTLVAGIVYCLHRG